MFQGRDYFFLPVEKIFSWAGKNKSGDVLLSPANFTFCPHAL